jgi:N-acetylmuramoyl-L-alanine amidase
LRKSLQRGTYLTLAAAVLLICVPVQARMTVAQKKQIAHKQFQTAEKMREALNGRPQAQRSRAAYSRVVEAYRKVYRLAPSGRDAAPSLLAMGEVMAESGRVLNDPTQSQAAIEQFKSIPNEYPGSHERVDALFTIGKIYQDDLDDLPQAKATFDDFLKKYPEHRLAADAKDALNEIADAQNPSAKKKRRGVDTAIVPSPPKKDLPKEKKEVVEKQKPADEPMPTVDVTANSAPLTPASISPPSAKGPLPLVTGVRHWSTPDYTRVAIDVDTEVKYEAGRIPSPDRIFFDLYNTKLAPELMGKSFDVNDGFLRKVRVAQYQRGLTRVVLEVDEVADYSAFLLPNPYRLIIDIHGKKPASQIAANPAPSKSAENPNASPSPTKAEVAKPNAPELKATEKPTTSPTFQTVAPRAEETKSNGKIVVDDNAEAKSATEPKTNATSKSDDEGVSKPVPTYADKRRKKDQLAGVTTREAKPTSLGERSLVRALGLKIGRIVVDAGHGGHDTGTIGPSGFKEKDLVLDVSLRLGKLLENKMGADVVYTRDDDTFVPLETRTAVANQNQADLFISVHANSSDDPGARGVETYYLNFTSSADALEVAARENAVSEKSIHELQDLVKKIALKDKIDESKEFASNVQSALYSGLNAKGGGPRNRGVKKAPFVVLIGANMPSILAEISFVSNPNDERKLQKPDYRQKIAESLYRGIAKYVGGLSGVKLASKTSQTEGQ